MKVKYAMTPNPLTTTPDSGLGDAWIIMREHDLGRLPVLDQGKLVGIITKADIGNRHKLDFEGISFADQYISDQHNLELNKVKVREIMTEVGHLVTISPDAYIEHAAQILRDSDFSGLLVVDDGGNLIGLITIKDITKYFLDIMALDHKGLRLILRIKNIPETLVQIAGILSKNGLNFENLVSMSVPKEENEEWVLILVVKTHDSKTIVQDFKAAGFIIESSTFND
jgi:acetoin utilization protein AcuB